MATSHTDSRSQGIGQGGAGDRSPSPGGPRRPPPLGRDPLLVVILASAAALGIGFGLLVALWAPKPVTAEVPLFIPTVSGISSLAAASVAFLAIGRYWVLGRPSAFWAALGFSALAILMAFYVLAWPGMGPDGGGIIATDPNTPAFLFNLAGAATLGPLIAAALARWPGPGHRSSSRWVRAAWLTAITLAGMLSVRFEASLPRLIVAGDYPTSSQMVAVGFLLACAGGAVLSTWRYRTTGDSLLGFVALFLVAQTFALAAFFVADQPYDVWWYLGRSLLAGGVATALFGLLGEYVGLYRREREQSAALRATEARLRRLNDTLEERVIERTRQLRALAVELASAEERERRRLADVLHDDLQQTLAAAVFHLDLAREQIPDERARAWLEEPMAMLREAIQTSRSLSAQLSPNLLSDTLLEALFQSLAHRMEEQHGLHVAVEAIEPADAPPLPDDLRLLLYRGVGELLFNVAKHAGVHEAAVQVDRSQPRIVRVVVSDQGRGFDPAQLGGGSHGLFSVTERLAHIGGDVHVDSAPGRGTRVSLVVPCEPPAPMVERGDAAADAHLRGPASTPQEPAGGSAEGRTRILLAGDHAILRPGLRRILDDRPDIIVVGEAPDGPRTVELARALYPDVVVIDPAMDGIDAIYRIAAELPGTRIISLSVFDASEQADRTRQAGPRGASPEGAPPPDS